MQLTDLRLWANESCESEADAYAFAEAARWPDGPTCPRCESRRCGTLSGASTRIGVRKCYSCRKPFRVTVGTPFHASHTPLAALCRAIALVMRGSNAAEIGRILRMTHKSAWLLSEKIKLALRA